MPGKCLEPPPPWEASSVPQYQRYTVDNTTAQSQPFWGLRGGGTSKLSGDYRVSRWHDALPAEDAWDVPPSYKMLLVSPTRSRYGILLFPSLPSSLWSGHTRKTKQLIGVVIHKQESRHKVPKSVLRAVLGRMQFTRHATRRTPHGASRLAQAMSAWLVKARRAPSRHSRDARAYGHTTTAMHKLSTPSPYLVSFIIARRNYYYCTTCMHRLTF